MLVRGDGELMGAKGREGSETSFVGTCMIGVC